MNLPLHFLSSTFARLVAADWLRSAMGACLGIIFTAAIAALLVRDPASRLLLMAPIGASAVLLFAVPASPLAQPWAILGGNFVSALLGVAVAQGVESPLLAAGSAVGIAIAAMSLLRCLHPPGGAVALTAVLGGQEIADLGFQFALAPVLVNSLILAGAAMLFNRATGHSYPHRAHEPEPAAVPRPQIELSEEDFDAVLAGYGEVLDITREDLESLYLELRERAEGRHREQTLGGIGATSLAA